MTAKPKDDAAFIKVLEDGIRKVLKDTTAKSADKLKAIQAGAQLLLVKHKIKGGEDDGNFFGSE
jgi:hypothetical protein